MPMKEELQLFRVENPDKDLKCSGCNWECSIFYSFGKSKKEAKSFFTPQEDMDPDEYGKGLCADCICEWIVDDEMKIR